MVACYNRTCCEAGATAAVVAALPTRFRRATIKGAAINTGWQHYNTSQLAACGQMNKYLRAAIHARASEVKAVLMCVLAGAPPEGQRHDLYMQTVQGKHVLGTGQ